MSGLKIVLGGYSQGASVIDIVAGVPIGGISLGDPLPPRYANNVAAVATFGDVADRAGGSLPTASALLGSKAIDLLSQDRKRHRRRSARRACCQRA